MPWAIVIIQLRKFIFSNCVADFRITDQGPRVPYKCFNKGYFRHKVWKYFCFHFIYFRRVMVSVSAEYWVVGNGAIMILSEYVLCILQLINLSPADARWETHYFSENIAQRVRQATSKISWLPPFNLSYVHIYFNKNWRIQ